MRAFLAWYSLHSFILPAQKFNKGRAFTLARALVPGLSPQSRSGTFPRQSASQNSYWSLQLCSYLWKYERNPNYTTGNGQMIPLNTHLSACYVPGCVLYPRNIKQTPAGPYPQETNDLVREISLGSSVLVTVHSASWCLRKCIPILLLKEVFVNCFLFENALTRV